MAKKEESNRLAWGLEKIEQNNQKKGKKQTCWGIIMTIARGDFIQNTQELFLIVFLMFSLQFGKTKFWWVRRENS